MVSNFDKTNHSVYKLTYHLVLVVKYRRKVITEPIFESLINIFNRVGSNYRIMVVEAILRQIIYTYCLKVELMLIFKDSLIPINLQAVESLKKNILKYMIVFGVESFGKEVIS